jgi:oligoribonuclease NrnB/cAMP/cGMP phosphodiesterase (DHH superfamily)
MLGMISGAREINRILFPAQDRAFKLSLIEAAKQRADEEDAPIQLDDDLHQIKKAFFRQKENNTKDNLVAYYVTDLLTKDKQRLTINYKYVTDLLTKDKQRLTINYKGYKGILGYNVGNASIIGNACMVENDDYDFYMDVNFRGHFSLRSNNKLDVSAMASHIGNGGGHPNASGGKVDGYKDSFVYADVRKFVQDYIDKKCE